MDRTICIFASILLIAFLSSIALTAVVIKWAQKTKFLCYPSDARYSRRTVALGGGIAIFINIALAIISSILLIKYLAIQTSLNISANTSLYVAGFANRISELIVLLACISVLCITGFIDDKKHLSARTKLFIQFIVAIAAAVFADIRVEIFIDNIFITTLLSVFWIVLLINSFNFLDNMDGLSAGIALICSSILMTAAINSDQLFVAGFAAVFIGTLAGFLIFNFPPAKIFMGDAGSLVIGFIVAVLTLKTTYYHQSSAQGAYSVFLPLIVVAVPLYDFISVCILRISQGRSPFVGDTQHFSHRIKSRGLTDRQTALTLYIATLTCGISGLFLYNVSLSQAVLIFVHTVLILILIAVLESSGGSFGKQK